VTTGHIDPDQLYTQLIEDSIRFMKTISEYYGVDQGMGVWQKISEHMGDDIKADIFMTMLQGDGHDSITLFRYQNTSVSAIAVIKLIRSATGCGLKEAKDLWDATATNQVRVVDVPRAGRSEYVREFRALGMGAR
jgi:ribosomal protein L7/L12